MIELITDINDLPGKKILSAKIISIKTPGIQENNEALSIIFKDETAIYLIVSGDNNLELFLSYDSIIPNQEKLDAGLITELEFCELEIDSLNDKKYRYDVNFDVEMELLQDKLKKSK